MASPKGTAALTGHQRVGFGCRQMLLRNLPCLVCSQLRHLEMASGQGQMSGHTDWLLPCCCTSTWPLLMRKLTRQ